MAILEPKDKDFLVRYYIYFFLKIRSSGTSEMKKYISYVENILYMMEIATAREQLNDIPISGKLLHVIQSQAYFYLVEEKNIPQERITEFCNSITFVFSSVNKQKFEDDTSELLSRHSDVKKLKAHLEMLPKYLETLKSGIHLYINNILKKSTVTAAKKAAQQISDFMQKMHEKPDETAPAAAPPIGKPAEPVPVVVPNRNEPAESGRVYISQNPEPKDIKNPASAVKELKKLSDLNRISNQAVKNVVKSLADLDSKAYKLSKDDKKNPKFIKEFAQVYSVTYDWCYNKNSSKSYKQSVSDADKQMIAHCFDIIWKALNVSVDKQEFKAGEAFTGGYDVKLSSKKNNARQAGIPWIIAENAEILKFTFKDGSVFTTGGEIELFEPNCFNELIVNEKNKEPIKNCLLNNVYVPLLNAHPDNPAAKENREKFKNNIVNLTKGQNELTKEVRKYLPVLITGVLKDDFNKRLSDINLEISVGESVDDKQERFVERDFNSREERLANAGRTVIRENFITLHDRQSGKDVTLQKGEAVSYVYESLYRYLKDTRPADEKIFGLLEELQGINVKDEVSKKEKVSDEWIIKYDEDTLENLKKKIASLSELKEGDFKMTVSDLRKKLKSFIKSAVQAFKDFLDPWEDKAIDKAFIEKKLSENKNKSREAILELLDGFLESEHKSKKVSIFDSVDEAYDAGTESIIIPGTSNEKKIFIIIKEQGKCREKKGGVPDVTERARAEMLSAEEAVPESFTEGFDKIIDFFRIILEASDKKVATLNILERNRNYFEITRGILEIKDKDYGKFKEELQKHQNKVALSEILSADPQEIFNIYDTNDKNLKGKISAEHQKLLEKYGEYFNSEWNKFKETEMKNKGIQSPDIKLGSRPEKEYKKLSPAPGDPVDDYENGRIVGITRRGVQVGNEILTGENVSPAVRVKGV